MTTTTETTTPSKLDQIKTIIKNEENEYDFANNIFDFIDIENLGNAESIEEIIWEIENCNTDNEITNEEVIYYATAIKYLQESDQSLAESLEIAMEFWYTIDKINSELLASLHKTRQNEEDFAEFLTNVKEALEQTNLFD